MAQAESSNSTMEMGTSDQELVAAKKKKRTAYIAGGIVMAIVIALVITAVVLLSGNEGGSSEELINTTEGPTTVVTQPTSPVTDAPTTEPTTEETPGPEPIDLNELNSGAYSPTSFSGSWVSGNDIMYLDPTGNLVLFNVNNESETILVSNSSEILRQSTRAALLSSDASTATIAHAIIPVYRHSFLARYTCINVQTGTEVEVGPAGVLEPYLQNFVWGPQATSLAFVYLNNVYYKSSLEAAAQQITTNGAVSVVYNGIPDWVYEEEVFGSNVALWFSPGGSHLAYATFDDTSVRVMQVPHYGVPGSAEDQYTRHNNIRYPKAGTINPTVSVTLVDLNNVGTTTLVQAPATLNEPVLLSVSFASETTIAVVWANRVQNQLEVNLCTLGQQTCTQIFSHSEPQGWVENHPFLFNAAGTSFITILPQTVDGEPWKQVVQVSQGSIEGGAWTLENLSNSSHTVAEIFKWSEDGVIWYKATHVNDSAQQHVYTISSAGAVGCFTCDILHSSGSSCLYNDAILSSDNTRVTVTCAGPSVPEIYIYNTNGERLITWDDNKEVAELVQNRQLPQVIHLSVPVQEGLPDARVRLQVPPNVESLNNVPLIVYVLYSDTVVVAADFYYHCQESSLQHGETGESPATGQHSPWTNSPPISTYAGPDSAQVTHSWSVDWGSSLVSRWGVAVAHIDGRGSGLKGVNNLFALNRQLGTVEVDDQISVTRYLQQNLSYIDSNRTCIWGWSYGGYASTLALVRGEDTFRCAIAVAPVTDWRYYDTIYTERYMDTPANNLAAYTNSSLLNAESALALRDKRYFLVHGTADDNVHYQQAMLFSRILQVNDVYFHQMSYTDEDHGLVGVRPHLYHGLEKFLEENML